MFDAVKERLTGSWTFWAANQQAAPAPARTAATVKAKHDPTCDAILKNDAYQLFCIFLLEPPESRRLVSVIKYALKHPGIGLDLILIHNLIPQDDAFANLRQDILNHYLGWGRAPRERLVETMKAAIDHNDKKYPGIIQSSLDDRTSFLHQVVSTTPVQFSLSAANPYEKPIAEQVRALLIENSTGSSSRPTPGK